MYSNVKSIPEPKTIVQVQPLDERPRSKLLETEFWSSYASDAIPSSPIASSTRGANTLTGPAKVKQQKQESRDEFVERYLNQQPRRRPPKIGSIHQIVKQSLDLNLGPAPGKNYVKHFSEGNTSGRLYIEKCYLAELDQEHVLATLKYPSVGSNSILSKGRHGIQNETNPAPPRLVQYNHPLPNPPKRQTNLNPTKVFTRMPSLADVAMAAKRKNTIDKQ